MDASKAVSLALSVAIVLGYAGPNSWAQGGQEDKTHPPGNNGTVKVDGEPWDSTPNNEPHPGCTFEIDFYGYDEGDLDATYEFALQSPSGSGTLESGSVFIGEDPAGGGKDWDASTGPIDLSGSLVSADAEANPNQGYHVSLTVHAEGSIGSDVKHKVFWVTECETQEAAGSASGVPSGAGETSSAAAAAAGPGSSSQGAATGQPFGPVGAAAAARPAGFLAEAAPARPIVGTPAFTG